MRLLKLEEGGELSQDEFYEEDIPPYAILSHTWGPDRAEVSFKDLEQGTGKNKAGYHKIQFCAQQAAIDNLQYFWIDTCCIDKSSSAELQEAIGSMFRWYHDARKCYAYLSDVSSNDRSSESWEVAFQNSKWFTRGWTLQELIAPAIVEFYSVEGERLGDKESLRHQIHEITGIAAEALQGSPLSDFSIEERMSWAAKRKTKRSEDAAYSLFGIFDVHMPIIYSEGKQKAFRRLNEEIQKNLAISSRISAQGSDQHDEGEQNSLEYEPETTKSDNSAWQSAERGIKRKRPEPHESSDDDESEQSFDSAIPEVLQPTSREDFPYTSLGEREFRVLVVVPGREHQIVQCAMITASVDQLTNYEAVSGLWSTEDSRWRDPIDICFLDSHGVSYLIPIHANLYNTLRNLRHPVKPRQFWVDTLCINHGIGAEEEKNKQVRMKRFIIRNAQNLCFCLAEDENTKIGLKFVPKILDLAEIDILVSDHRAIDNWLAYVALLRNTAFSELCLIEEVALAQSVTLHCGQAAIHYNDFAVAMALFISFRDEVAQLHRHSQRDYRELRDRSITMAERFIDVSTNAVRTTSFGIQRLFTLEALVSRLSEFKVTNPRDRIFSVLAIARDGSASDEDTPMGTSPQLASFDRTLRIDYARSVSEVYQDFVIQSTLRSQSLDLICRPWASSESKEERNLPTWVRSMQSRMRKFDFGFSERTSADCLVGLPGQSCYMASRGKTADFRFGVSLGSTQLLLAKGICVGSISMLAPRASEGVVFLEWMQLGGCVNLPDGTYEVPERYWRTLVADRGPNGARAPLWYYRALQYCLLNNTGMGDMYTNRLIYEWDEKHSKIVEFLRRVQSVVWDRKLLLSQNTGMIGLAPAVAQEGDIIVVLYGCTVPVLLRSFRSRQGDGSDYSLVGECYVHGIMDGEAVENATAKGFHEEEFAIL